MSHLKLRFAAILLAIAIMPVFTSTSFAQNPSDQVVVWLRHDWAEANNAQNFALWIQPSTPLPSSSAARSLGYLGAWVGSDYSKFIQVGYELNPIGVRWFAEDPNTSGIVCDRGHRYTTSSGAGCSGDYNDYASLDQFHMIQLDTNLNGTWQAFVYDAQGRGVQVAHEYFGTNVLYQMVTSSAESLLCSRSVHHDKVLSLPSQVLQIWWGG